MPKKKKELCYSCKHFWAGADESPAKDAKGNGVGMIGHHCTKMSWGLSGIDKPVLCCWYEEERPADELQHTLGVLDERIHNLEHSEKIRDFEAKTNSIPIQAEVGELIDPPPRIVYNIQGDYNDNNG